MIIDIIVPHYKEDTKTLLTALSSIDNQVGYSSLIQITVVTDKGGLNIDKDLIKKSLKSSIQFITTDKHLGPGYARQYAMDRTLGDYIMFCDSDDMLASPFVFKFFEDTLKQYPNIEIILTGYLEENLIKGKFKYEHKDDDISIVCLHGKLYNRSFIYKHNITFPNLMCSEDGVFNFKCVCHAKNAYFNDDVDTYIYKYNPNSITRKDTSFINSAANIRAFAETINAFEAFFKEIIENKASQINTKIIKPFINSLDTQLNMLSTIPNLTSDNLKELNNSEKRLNTLKETFKKYL